MRRLFGFLAVLCLIFVTMRGVAVPSVRAEDVTQRDIAIRWSPFFYQASQNNYDIPTNFDFDGDWDGYNNWNNAEVYINNFRARVYYTYQESASSIWLTYLVFHPRDYKALFGHENDMEGVRVTIRKVEGNAYGEFVSYLTFGHGIFYVTDQPEWIGTHPAAYVEAKGHGIKYWNDGIFPDSCGGMGIWYAGRGAETPSHCNDRDVSMDLISFEDTLWPFRIDYYMGTYSDGARFVTGGDYGGSYRGHDGCKANPPWNWAGDGGAWFLTPSSESFVVNPYASTSSAAMPPCP